MDFALLAGSTAAGPVARVFIDTMPDKSLGHQLGGGAAGWMRKTVGQVKNLAAHVSRHEWARTTGTCVAEQSSALISERDIRPAQACDCCSVGVGFRVALLCVGKGVVVDTQVDTVDFHARKGVGYRILLARNVLHHTAVLGNGRQVALLPGRPRVPGFHEGVIKRLVICLDGEIGALEQVPELADGQVDSEKLPVEGAVVSFCWS